MGTTCLEATIDFDLTMDAQTGPCRRLRIIGADSHISVGGSSWRSSRCLRPSFWIGMSGASVLSGDFISFFGHGICRYGGIQHGTRVIGSSQNDSHYLSLCLLTNFLFDSLYTILQMASAAGALASILAYSTPTSPS
eukprot:scaffold45574_cov46-Attheya_sp.AAC.1